MKNLDFYITFPILLCSYSSIISCTQNELPENTNNKENNDYISLKLVSYNVKYFSYDNNDPLNYFTIASLMRELKADIICLQELDSCTTRTNGHFQLARFTQYMGWDNYYFGKAIDYQKGGYGIGISSREKIENSFKIILPTGAENRIIAIAEFQDYIVASVHLDHKLNQLAEAEEINKNMYKLYQNSNKPVFLLGDFNSKTDSETISLLKEKWKIISSDKNTFPASSPSQRIDYIMQLKNGITCTVVETDVPSAYTLTQGDISRASDHRPVYTIVKFKKNKQTDIQ